MITIIESKKLIREEISILENPRTVFTVLGCICKYPHLLREKTTVLTKGDFQNPMYRIIFAAINNIIKSDAKIETVTAEDIDNFLSAFPEHYNIYAANNNEGFKFISEAIEKANKSVFGVCYQRLKKFSLLRHYHSFGFDIRTLYDYELAQNNFIEAGKLNQKIENLTQQEIIDHFTMEFMKIKDSWEMDDGTGCIEVKDEIGGLLERLRQSPIIGNPYDSFKYNELFKGKLKGRFFLRSADTGHGKSRLMEKDVAYSACDEWYDYDKGWVGNGNNEKVLYISTELEPDEAMTMFLAALTGIGTSEIEKGNYGTSIDQRIKKGQEVLERANIYLEKIEDFSIQDIENIIEKHIIEHGVTEVYFDYIQITPKNSRFMAELFNMNLREDQILVFFAQALKSLAVKYNIYLQSATQLSRDENWDARRLAGGKATANKVDQGVIITKINKEQLKGIANILKSEMGFKKPNYCHYVYKNRKGKDFVIIFTNMNLGCGREEFCFATDYNFNPVNIADLVINVEQINPINDKHATPGVTF